MGPGFTHFVGCAGVGVQAARLGITNADAGFFGYGRVTKRSDVTGLQMATIMVTETMIDNGRWTEGGPATVRGFDPADQSPIGNHRPFGGLHQAGANVLFMDGSVKCLAPNIDPNLWLNLARIHKEADPVPDLP